MCHQSVSRTERLLCEMWSCASLTRTQHPHNDTARHHLTTPPRGKGMIRYETICVRPPTRPSAHIYFIIYTYTHLHDANQNFADHRCHKFSQTIGVKSHQRLSRQSLTPTRRLLRRDFSASTSEFVKSLWSISQRPFSLIVEAASALRETAISMPRFHN